MPSYPGHFEGEVLHSHDVKSKEQLKGKRVLVVGAGNSAVDILSDAALDGARAVHSMRRTYYFFPKMVFGKPTDVFIDLTSRWPLPRSDYQARLIASFVAACESDPKRAAWFRALKARANPDIGHGIDWKDSPWHKFEIQHYRFRMYMKRLLKKLGNSAGKPAQPRTMQGAAAAGTKAPLKLAS